MAAKTNIKKQREEQLYARGLTVTQIAERFRISHQAVSKQLKLKANPELRREHGAHHDLDEGLRAGEDGPRMRERVRELYAQGLSVDFIVEQLRRPRQAVAEMVEGDAELGKQHAARLAMDRKLIGEEPAPADDFSVDHRDSLPKDRGDDAESRSATRMATEERPAQARNASEGRPEVQPVDRAGRETCDDNRGEPAVNGTPAAEAEAAERGRATRSATSEHPALQPRKATTEQEVQPRNATAERTEVQPPRSQQRNPEERAAEAAAERIVQQVIEQVRVAYGYRPDQFTGKEPTPQLKEARQAAMFIASRVTGLSSVQLGAIFGCDESTILHAIDEIAMIFTVDETLRERILGTDARIREEFGIPRIIPR